MNYIKIVNSLLKLPWFKYIGFAFLIFILGMILKGIIFKQKKSKQFCYILACFLSLGMSLLSFMIPKFEKIYWPFAIILFIFYWCFSVFLYEGFSFIKKIKLHEKIIEKFFSKK